MKTLIIPKKQVQKEVGNLERSYLGSVQTADKRRLKEAVAEVVAALFAARGGFPPEAGRRSSAKGCVIFAG